MLSTPPPAAINQPSATLVSGDGHAVDPWTEDRVAAMTKDGDADACYYGIFAGEICNSDGGVYKISENWYVQIAMP